MFALGEVRQRAAVIFTNTIISIMLNIPGWYDGLRDVSFQAVFCEQCYCLCSLRLFYIHFTAVTTAPWRTSNSVLMLRFSFCPPLQNWLKWYTRTPSYVPKESNWDVISALVWTFFFVPFRLKKGKIESSSCCIPQSGSLFDCNAFTGCACVCLILFIRSRSDSNGVVVVLSLNR